MPISNSLLSRAIVLAIAAMPLLAQPARPASPRIVQAIDEARLVTLRGNTHPLARAEYDQGAAPADLPMERILMLLSRSPEQEAALQQLLAEQQDATSSHYHEWLTPEQFGERFGPAPEDIDKITGWLKSQGFRVDSVANGRQTVEFSGTAGQLERALHTQIHGYLVRGERHWANAQDPQVPAALAPVVAGIVSLHDFRRQAMRRDAGTSRQAPGEATWSRVYPAPLYTTGGTSKEYDLAPYDFATIYNVLPLWSAGIDGTGQTVAIVARSNIDPTDVTRFRSVFGLPANAPKITLNGTDPGLVTDDESEAVADVEWVGAVAKGATIDLVVSQSTTPTDGIDLSTRYIVDRNLAPVLSSGYGTCEKVMSTQEKQFYNNYWQQASSQGITAVVAAGDGGSGFCDSGQVYAQRGLQVNGLASTPYNVAVGGTDFNDVLDQTAVAYWSNSNDSSTLASVKSYIPELTWNDSCAGPQVVVFVYNYFGDITPAALCNDPLAAYFGLVYVRSGSGGASGYYAKPSWQSGVRGIPTDTQRDLPDVSLFAGDGFLGHAYPTCQADQQAPCDPSSATGLVTASGGGTSYSAQAFAGVMTLVNQKVGGRQGLANPMLYQLASTQYGTTNSPNPTTLRACDSSFPIAAGNSCVFYDVTYGTNDVPCLFATADCYLTNSTDYYGLLSTSSTSLVPAYPAVPGYDLSTGLGSVNVANLVKQWNAVATAPGLGIVKTHAGNFAPGQAGATYGVSVSNGASAAGPTVGAVTVTEVVPAGLTLVSMSGAGWTCTAPACTRSDALPVGASYPPITVTVNVSPGAAPQVTNQVTVSGGGSVSATASDVTTVATPVGTRPSGMTLSANPSSIATTGSTTLTASFGVVTDIAETGTVTFSLGSTPLGSAPVGAVGPTAAAVLVVQGSLLAVGSNTITAHYGGDVIFATSSATVTVMVAAPPAITPGGVINAASFLGGPVSPGEIVSIFGTGIGPATPAFLTLDSSNKVETSIGGVTVSFNGFLAPLTYVGSTQINAVVPYEIAGNSAPFVQVTYGGLTSSQLSLQLAATAPAIFTYNGSGSGPGAILNADSSVNTQSNPAAKGSIIQIFMTGEGLTTPAQATGSVTQVNVSGTGPLTPAPQQAVSVTIGGLPADLKFAGEAPYTVAGVLQVNAAVPAAAASGADSLVVKVGSQSSPNGVTVWVQ
jgi:uncharacterized protein (TIGR03437 family)